MGQMFQLNPQTQQQNRNTKGWEREAWGVGVSYWIFQPKLRTKSWKQRVVMDILLNSILTMVRFYVKFILWL